MIPSQQFQVWLIILAGIPIIFAAVLAFVGIVLSIMNKKIDSVHLQINSRMDELIESVKAEARSRGNIEGREQAKDEQEKRNEAKLQKQTS